MIQVNYPTVTSIEWLAANIGMTRGVCTNIVRLQGNGYQLIIDSNNNLWANNEVITRLGLTTHTNNRK